MKLDELPEKMTLGEILELMDKMDDGEVELSPDDMALLGKKLECKIDDYRKMQLAYKLRQEVLAFEAAKLNEQAKVLLDAANRIDCKIDRLNDLLMFHMKHIGVTKFKGDFYNVTAFQRSDVKLTVVGNPTANDLFADPDLVNTTLSWKKAELKKLVKKEPEKYAKFGHPIKIDQLKWTANSEAKLT